MRNDLELRAVVSAIERHVPAATEHDAVLLLSLVIIGSELTGLDAQLRELVQAWPRKRAGRISERRRRSGFEHAEYVTHRFLDAAAAEWATNPRPWISAEITDRIAAGVTLGRIIDGFPVRGVDAVRTYARAVCLAQAVAFLAGRGTVGEADAQVAIVYAVSGCDRRRMRLLRFLYGRSEPTATRAVLDAMGIESNVSPTLRALVDAGVVDQGRGRGTIAATYTLSGRARDLIEQALMPWQAPKLRAMAG